MGTFVPDLIGSKDGTFSNQKVTTGLGYNSLISSAARIRSSMDQTIDFGDFSDSCVGDFTQCQNGITIAFWLKILSKKTGDVLYTSGRDRGIAIGYSKDSSQLNVRIFSSNERHKVSAEITDLVWYHVFVAGRIGAIPWMVINGAEVMWGTKETMNKAMGRGSPFLVGKQRADGESSFKISQLVIWVKALSMRDMKSVYHCAGIQPGKLIHTGSNVSLGMSPNPKSKGIVMHEKIKFSNKRNDTWFLSHESYHGVAVFVDFNQSSSDLVRGSGTTNAGKFLFIYSVCSMYIY